MGDKMFNNIKDIGIMFGIIASIIGASIAYGKSNEQIKETKQSIIEIKQDIEKGEERDLEQTKLIIKATVEIKNLAEVVKGIKK